MILPVTHHILVHEQVEIPDRCPSCAASLYEKNAIRCFEFQDQKRLATMLVHKVPGQDGEAPEYPELLEWDEGLPEQCDNSFEVEWQCADCGFAVVEARIINYSGQNETTYPVVPEEVRRRLRL